MGYAAHQEIDTSVIPIIDIGPLRDGSAEFGVAREIHEASRDVGFLYIRNHGIDPSVSCSDGEGPGHDPTACGDYLVSRMARAFSYDDGPS